MLYVRCDAEPPAAPVRAASSHTLPYLRPPASLLVHLFDLLSYLAIACPDQLWFARQSANRVTPELFRYVDCRLMVCRLNAPNVKGVRGIIIVLAATSAPSYGCGTPLAVTGICQSGPKPVSIHSY